MTGPTYPSTPYVQRLTPANGWHGQLIRDQHGRIDVIVAVRIGPTWTDAVAIAGEDRVVALRHRTDEDRLILPTEPTAERAAVWRRDGRAEDVLAELLDLPTG
ncbi:MAG: hypothetical protein GEU83_12950 [Pseudonocardiaceae bacterium]|nr:hypothetical protein [Pseudonocardiaceae bacterium]